MEGSRWRRLGLLALSLGLAVAVEPANATLLRKVPWGSPPARKLAGVTCGAGLTGIEDESGANWAITANLVDGVLVNPAFSNGGARDYAFENVPYFMEGGAVAVHSTKPWPGQNLGTWTLKIDYAPPTMIYVFARAEGASGLAAAVAADGGWQEVDPGSFMIHRPSGNPSFLKVYMKLHATGSSVSLTLTSLLVGGASSGPQCEDYTFTTTATTSTSTTLTTTMSSTSTATWTSRTLTATSTTTTTLTMTSTTRTTSTTTSVTTTDTSTSSSSLTSTSTSLTSTSSSTTTTTCGTLTGINDTSGADWELEGSLDEDVLTNPFRRRAHRDYVFRGVPEEMASGVVARSTAEPWPGASRSAQETWDWTIQYAPPASLYVFEDSGRDAGLEAALAADGGWTEVNATGFTIYRFPRYTSENSSALRAWSKLLLEGSSLTLTLTDLLVGGVSAGRACDMPTKTTTTATATGTATATTSTSTTSTATATTTMATLTFNYTMESLSYDAIAANELLQAGILATVRSTILAKFPDGAASDVVVSIHPGSVRFEVTFVAAPGVTKDTLESTFNAARKTLENSLLARLTNMPGIALVTTGSMTPAPRLPGQIGADERKASGTLLAVVSVAAIAALLLACLCMTFMHRTSSVAPKAAPKAADRPVSRHLDAQRKGDTLRKAAGATDGDAASLAETGPERPDSGAGIRVVMEEPEPEEPEEPEEAEAGICVVTPEEALPEATEQERFGFRRVIVQV